MVDPQGGYEEMMSCIEMYLARKTNGVLLRSRGGEIQDNFNARPRLWGREEPKEGESLLMRADMTFEIIALLGSGEG